MTKREIIPSPIIGLTHIRLVPVVDKGTVVLYDMYKAGEWLGSKRTLKECIHFNTQLRNKSFAKEVEI